jgi:hypothetical protein
MIRWCSKVEVMMFRTTCSRQKEAIVAISLNQPLTTADDLPENLSYNWDGNAGFRGRRCALS